MNVRQGGWSAVRRLRWPHRLFLVLVAGCVGCDRLPSDAVRQIRQGHGAYERGDYAGAQQLLSPVIARHAGHSDVAEAQYVRGLARVKLGQTEAARRDFQGALGVAVRPELKGLLYAQLGNLEYEAGRYEEAASQYRRAEPHIDDQSPSDRILLRYGLSLQRCGRFRQAKVVLLDLLDRFPNGPAAAEARQALAHVGNHYSIQCGVYSQEANAQATASKLRRHGFDASAWRETANGAGRYVVRAGKYPRRGEAERDLPRIRSLIPDAFVVP